MAEENKNPIINFKPREQDNGNVPGGGGNEKEPSWVLSGKKLENKKEMLISNMRDIKEDWDKTNISGLPHVLSVYFRDEAKAKSKQVRILPLFTFGRDAGQIGFEGEDTILIKLAEKEQLDKIVEELNDKNKNAFSISAINSIKYYQPDLKAGKKGCAYEITPINYYDEGANKRAFEIIQFNLKKYNLPSKLIEYTDDLKTIKTDYISQDKLKFMRTLPIRSAAPINKVSFPKKRKINVNNFSSQKFIKYDPNKEYPIVGLLDSGVDINQMTIGWVTKGKGCRYSDSQLDKGHGTYIATLLIHGDEINNVHDSSMEGCRIIDVPVVPKEPKDEDEILENIKEAVIKNPNVKIWNLSVSGEETISSDSFSKFAIVLDDLQKVYNVTFCKSAGNDNNFLRKKASGPLSSGAESVRSLVVGSMNRDSDKYGFTKKGYSSPYSRRGKGPESLVKPDVVHYGGDLLAQKKNPKNIDKDFKISGDVSSIDGVNPEATVGTSFSTPKVAKQLGELDLMTKGKYSNLTLKALEIHSAKYSNEVKTLDENEKLCTLGYGKPENAADILYSPSFANTYILEGNLEQKKRIDIIDFPYPNVLIRDGFFYGKIKVTLVCDPVLIRNNGSEYCQSNLDIKFGTYDRKENTTQFMQQFNPIKRVDSFNALLKGHYSKNALKSSTRFATERLLIDYGKKYQAVKKYVIDLNELTPANKNKIAQDRKWFLFLEGHYRNFIESQAAKLNEKLFIPFSLIISIEDPDEKQDVYDSAIKELKNYNFVYNSVEINNNINLNY